MTTHYQRLGVDETADHVAIRAVYRAKMKLTHPDTGGDEESTKALNDAYRVLSKPELRRAYDAELAAARRVASASTSDRVAPSAAPTAPGPSWGDETGWGDEAPHRPPPPRPDFSPPPPPPPGFSPPPRFTPPAGPPPKAPPRFTPTAGPPFPPASPPPKAPPCGAPWMPPGGPVYGGATSARPSAPAADVTLKLVGPKGSASRRWAVAFWFVSAVHLLLAAYSTVTSRPLEGTEPYLQGLWIVLSIAVAKLRLSYPRLSLVVYVAWCGLAAVMAFLTMGVMLPWLVTYVGLVETRRRELSRS